MRKNRARLVAGRAAILLLAAGLITSPAAAADPGDSPVERFHLTFSGWRASPEGRRALDSPSGRGTLAEDIGDEIDIQGPDTGRDSVFIARGARHGVVVEYANFDVESSGRLLGQVVTNQVAQSFTRVQYSGAVVHRRHLDVIALVGVLDYSVGVGAGSQGQLIPAGGLAAEVRLSEDRLQIRAEALRGGYHTPNRNLVSHFNIWSAFADYYPFRRARFLGFRGGFLATNVSSTQVESNNEYDLRLRGAVFGMSFRFR
ncbi:MAG: hypothetical protein HY049_16275 [Acidobacteria bacterium]|nr:hypothetical protein [Acidobacteriota bacterium]